MNIEDINGYVTAAYVGKWWVGVVLEKDLIKNEVKIEGGKKYFINIFFINTYKFINFKAFLYA